MVLLVGRGVTPTTTTMVGATTTTFATTIAIATPTAITTITFITTTTTITITSITPAKETQELKAKRNMMLSTLSNRKEFFYN
jgi:hypothetical protein